jgi:hypothetical protein
LLIQVSDHELVQVLPDYVALLEAGKPVEAYVFPDEYHIKWHPLHKLAVGERTIDWFRFWLEGEEDPAPEKASQYFRWRELRRHARSGLSGTGGGLCTEGGAPGPHPDFGGDTRQEGR